ncbi:hypothetical protein KM043_013583 [Ampulex compressa]|nr:hypothetical protein KM043_013583 [Ampulex compressa]
MCKYPQTSESAPILSLGSVMSARHFALEETPSLPGSTRHLPGYLRRIKDDELRDETRLAGRGIMTEGNRTGGYVRTFTSEKVLHLLEPEEVRAVAGMRDGFDLCGISTRSLSPGGGSDSPYRTSTLACKLKRPALMDDYETRGTPGV